MGGGGGWGHVSSVFLNHLWAMGLGVVGWERKDGELYNVSFGFEPSFWYSGRAFLVLC
jgi:hypothetical protein